MQIDLNKEGIRIAQEEGIVFLDEIDKLAVNERASTQGKGVSTEGEQRDLLPLIEGTMVSTKYGDKKTDHILFITSGSFSMAKVGDLIPELLGRLPIRVSLSPLSEHELFRVLTEPENNLIEEQVDLLAAENVDLKITRDVTVT